MSEAVLLLRWVAALTAIYNLTWSFRGPIDMAKGYRRSPPAIYLSVVFWHAIVVLSFWGAWLLNPTPARESTPPLLIWRLLSYLLQTVTMGLAAYGHRIGALMKAQKFYAMYDHLDEAFAIVDLARVDPGQAERVAADCRKRTAAAILAEKP